MGLSNIKLGKLNLEQTEAMLNDDGTGTLMFELESDTEEIGDWVEVLHNLAWGNKRLPHITAMYGWLCVPCDPSEFDDQMRADIGECIERTNIKFKPREVEEKRRRDDGANAHASFRERLEALGAKLSKRNKVD